jgi:hypothetical protein
MISWDEAERLKREAGEHGRSSIQISVVGLSLIFSLAAVAIISKDPSSNSLWFDLAAFVVPIPIALYFKRRIVQLGDFAYLAALILTLSAAVLFGI